METDLFQSFGEGVLARHCGAAQCMTGIEPESNPESQRTSSRSSDSQL